MAMNIDDEHPSGWTTVYKDGLVREHFIIYSCKFSSIMDSTAEHHESDTIRIRNSYLEMSSIQVIRHVQC